MTFKLWERIRDWIILGVLLVAAVVVMVAQNDPMLRGLRAFSLETTSWMEARFAWLGSYFRALDENDLLRAENISLSSTVARSREAQLENERLRRLLGFRDTTRLRLRAARIVAKDITRQQNLLTINVGRRDSVEVDMAVVDDRGVIGKVVLVSDHYARVMPYMNTDFRAPAKVLPLQAEGILRWDPDDAAHVLLEHISRTEPVLRGQLVVTSGFSGTFPPGYPVGYVDSVATRPGRPELVVYVSPASPLDRAEYVFVVLEHPVPERMQLEQQPVR